MKLIDDKIHNSMPYNGEIALSGYFFNQMQLFITIGIHFQS